MLNRENLNRTTPFNEDEDEQQILIDKPLVYVAAPKQIFDTAMFNRYLSKIFEDYRNCNIKVCSYEFQDLEQWQDLWLHLVLLIDKLIFVSDEKGFIAYGEWQTIRTCHPKTEILYLSPEFEYIPINDVAIVVAENGYCLRHFANVLIKRNIR